jgi:tripartite-type tricarboxylate transporter receptor subunit TctC
MACQLPYSKQIRKSLASSAAKECRMKQNYIVSAAATIAATLFFLGPPSMAANDFYKGKTLTFLVGYRAGGGYDTFTRTVARHIGRHIPGNPSANVQNRGGAGSLIAANTIYNNTKPDGLTLGVFGAGLVTQQALGARGIRFDAPKFNWVGSMSRGTPVCGIMRFTGLKTLNDVQNAKTPLKMGSTGSGSTTDDLPKLMNGFMNTHFDVISGFKGTSAIRLAMRRHELDGACWTWESMRATARTLLDAKGNDKLIPFVIEGKYEEPEVKDLPQFTEIIKDKEVLAAFKAWLNPYEFFRPIVLPPKTPSDRVEILRAALKETMEDSKFLADAKNSKLDVAYTSGKRIEDLVEEVLAISPTAKEKLIALIGSKPTN